MALTMTRTRTQTARTKLTHKLGEVKGELAFVEEWMTEAGVPVELALRRALLREQAQALVTTLQLFDPELDARQVVASEGWRTVYRSKTGSRLRARYTATLP